MTHWQILSVILTLSIVGNGLLVQLLMHHRKVRGNTAEELDKLKQTISYNKRRLAEYEAKLNLLNGEFHHIEAYSLRLSVLNIGYETARNYHMVHGHPINESDLYHRMVTCIMGNCSQSLQRQMLAVFDMDDDNRIFVNGYGHLLTTKEECAAVEQSRQSASAKK